MSENQLTTGKPYFSRLLTALSSSFLVVYLCWLAMFSPTFRRFLDDPAVLGVGAAVVLALSLPAPAISAALFRHSQFKLIVFSQVLTITALALSFAR